MGRPGHYQGKAGTISSVYVVFDAAPVSVALARHMLWRFAGAPDHSELLELDGPLAATLGSGGDVKEGVAAFLEARSQPFHFH
jgi:hypothetical protein